VRDNTKVRTKDLLENFTGLQSSVAGKRIDNACLDPFSLHGSANDTSSRQE
jgi:hypothetical protein